MRILRFLPLLPALALLGLASSCDRSVRDNSTSSESAMVQLAPRILLDNGMPVIPVESVRMVVTLDGKAHFDTTVDFGLKKLSAVGIPVGAKWELSVYGLRKPTSGRRLVVWWKGSKSGTAEANPGHVDWDTTFVTVQDTTGPELSSNYGFPQTSVITYRTGEPTETRKLQFQALKTDSVFLSDSTCTKDTLIKGSGDAQFLLYVVNFDFTKASSRTFYIKVVDSAGNTSTRKLTFERGPDIPPTTTDTTAPTIRFKTPSGDIKIDSSLSSFEVEVEPLFKGSDSGIDSVIINGTKLVATPWKTTISLSPGTNVVKAVAYARNGRDSSASLTITLPPRKGSDSTPPRIERGQGMPIKPLDSLIVTWRTDSADLSWTITDSSTLTVKLNDADFAQSSTKSVWTAKKRLSYGRNEFRLWANDSFGYASYDTVRIWRQKDTTHPIIEGITGINDTNFLAFATDSFKVSWTVSDADTVTSVKIGNTPATRTDSAWGRTINLPKKLDGYDTTIVIEAKDRWGTTTRDSVVLRIARDSIKPMLTKMKGTQTQDLSYSYKDSSTLAGWTVTDPGGIQWVKINDTVVTSINSDYRMSIALDSGTNLIRIEVLDSAGNSNRDSITITVKPKSADTTPPTIKLQSPSDKSLSVPWETAKHTFQWIIKDNNKVQSARLDTFALTFADSIGSVTRALKVGPDTFVLVATDAAGNKASDTLYITRKADTTHPKLKGPKTLSFPFGTTNLDTSWIVTDLDTIIKVTLNGTTVPLTKDSILRIKPTLWKVAAGYDTVLVIEAQDLAGNTTKDSLVVTLLPDKTPPKIELSSPSTRDTLLPATTQSFVVQWKVSDNDAVSIVKYGDVQHNGTGPVYQANIAFDKSDTVMVKLSAYDVKGNVAYDSIRLRRKPSDSIPPKVDRKRPVGRYDTLNVKKELYDLAWTVTDVHLDSNSVRVNGVTAIYYPTLGEFSLSLPLTQDTTQFILTARDSTGNETRDTVYIVRTGATSMSESAPGWASMEGGTTGGAGGRKDTVRTLEQLRERASLAGAGIIFVDGVIGEPLENASTPPLIDVNSNKSILGLVGAEIHGAFVLKDNIILRNLTILGPGGNSQAGKPVDAIAITGAKKIWIDHCDITDAQGESIDITSGADLITVSRTVFSFTNKTPKTGGSWNGTRVGESKYSNLDSGKLRTTFYQNQWGAPVRAHMPLVRFGKVHVINNLYSTDSAYSTSVIQAGQSADILVEANYFTRTKDPVSILSTESSQKVNVMADNFLDGTTGTKTGINPTTVFTPPYTKLTAYPPTSLSTSIRDNGGIGTSIIGWKR